MRDLIPKVIQSNECLGALVHEILEHRTGASSEPLANLSAGVSSHIHLENDILFSRAVKLLV